VDPAVPRDCGRGQGKTIGIDATTVEANAAFNEEYKRKLRRSRRSRQTRVKK
jgi:hypothetical protein